MEKVFDIIIKYGNNILNQSEEYNSLLEKSQTLTVNETNKLLKVLNKYQYNTNYNKIIYDEKFTKILFENIQLFDS